MRNISTLRDSICCLDADQTHDSVSSLTRMCTDSDTGNVYAADVTHGSVCCLASTNQVRCDVCAIISRKHEGAHNLSAKVSASCASKWTHFKCFTCLQVLWTQSLQDTPGDGLGPDSQITSIAYLPEMEALCIAATAGELLLVQTSRGVQEASGTRCIDDPIQQTSSKAAFRAYQVCRLVNLKRAQPAVHGAQIKNF